MLLVNGADPRIWPPPSLPPRPPGGETQDWLCDWGASSHRIFGCNQSCCFPSRSHSRTTSVSTSPPTKCRPFHLCQTCLCRSQTTSGENRFYCGQALSRPGSKNRGQRGGNLVGQTPRILDPEDNLQARFPASNSHSSHLRLLKTQVEADPSSQAYRCRLHDNASAWRAFVVSTSDVGFSFPALDQHKPEQEAPGEAHARVLAGIKASWPRPRWEEWHHSWSPTWSVSAGGVDSGQIWVIDPLRGSQAVIIRPKIKFTRHLSCQLKLFCFLFPFARTGYYFYLPQHFTNSGPELWMSGR